MFVSDRGKVHLRWRLENLKIWESPNAPVNWVWSEPPFEGRMSIWKRAKQEGKVVTLFSVTFMSFGVSASSVFVHTKTYLHLPSVGCLRGLGGLAFGARWIAYDARNCTKCNPRRAHNLAQIIVCYNYHSAELRVSGLPKMALWYICTFGLWYIWTLAHLDFGTSVSPLFPYCRTNGGRFHGSLSSPSCTPLSYKWGTHSLWLPFLIW